MYGHHQLTVHRSTLEDRLMGQDPGLRQEFRALTERRGVRHLLSRQPTLTAQSLAEEMRSTAYGPDLDARFYAEIMRMPIGAVNEDGALQAIIDQMASDIEEVLLENRIRIPEKTYAGQYPHGSFNAQSLLVHEGVLVSLNSGLMMLIYQTAKVLTMATRFTEYDEEGAIISHREIADFDVTREQISAYLAEIVLNYLRFDDPTLARRLPALGGVRAVSLHLLVNATETFALAHEYGHIVDGHFDDITPSSSEVDWIQKKHHQEFAADEIAASIMIRRLDKHIESDELLLHASFATAGCLFFFALGFLIEEVRARVTEVPSEPAATSTHPPAIKRLERLYALFKGQGFELSTARAHMEWLFEQIDPVVAQIRHDLGT